MRESSMKKRRLVLVVSLIVRVVTLTLPVVTLAVLDIILDATGKVSVFGIGSVLGRHLTNQ